LNGRPGLTPQFSDIRKSGGFDPVLDYSSLPKFELHVHMEGCIQKDDLFALQLLRNPTLSREEFEGRFKFEHFGQFISLWCEHQGLLFQQKCPLEILPGIVQSIGRFFRDQKILYVEAHISPIDSLFMRHGKSGILDNAPFYEEVLLGWDQSVEELKNDESMPVIRLIVDLVRNYPQEVFDWQVKSLEKIFYRLRNVIGVGLGGGGDRRRLTVFREGFARLKACGFQVFAHAGELPPAHQACLEVRDAVEIGAQRIGHGIHCSDDRELLEILCDRGIPLEICPTSNLMTRSVAQLEDHPLMQFFQAEVPFTINSDDPVYFSTDLNREYELTQQTFELSDVDMVQILLNSFQHSFASDELKSFAKEELSRCL
jgi:adenosine deaminase